MNTAQDGRRKRSERSKQKIAAAMIELIMEGDLTPPAEAIAERADVGLRSVFRHFKDMDSLFLEVSRLFRKQHQTSFRVPIEGKTWEDKLHAMAASRADTFDSILPVLQSTDIHMHRSQVVREDYEAINKALRKSICDLVPQPLQNDPDLIDGLDAVLCSAFWLRLRIDQQLSTQRARSVITSVLTAILAPINETG